MKRSKAIELRYEAVDLYFLNTTAGIFIFLLNSIKIETERLLHEVQLFYCEIIVQGSQLLQINYPRVECQNIVSHHPPTSYRV